MKGISFQKPLEFNVKVDGESWNQGDPVLGELLVKNHGSDAQSLAEVFVQLAYGELKRVRVRDPDAFELLGSTKFDLNGSLSPLEEKSFRWKFQTERNCPITDASGSLFLVYGT